MSTQKVTELLRGKSSAERLEIMDRAEAIVDKKIEKMKKSGSAPDADGIQEMIDAEIIALLEK